MTKTPMIGIGLMGLGVVGSSVFQALTQKEGELSLQAGTNLKIIKVLIRNPEKPRPVKVDPSLLTTKAEDILFNPQVDIVVELIGGESPAKEFIREAILQGKHVVTANKEVIAKHGHELFPLASRMGVVIKYEGSVGGGIPLISPLINDLAGNKIRSIKAIINGTTNYILTRMSKEGEDFLTALRRAKELGYAEPNPASDIEGIDAAYKLAILSSLAFNTPIHPNDVYYEGITKISSRDFKYAAELNYTIKLLAIAKDEGGVIEARVHPALIPQGSLLAKVEGAYNAVQIEGDLIGDLVFYGMGAGPLPTSSAVLADIISISRDISRGIRPQLRINFSENKKLMPISMLRSRYYLRMWVVDRPGALAKIAEVLGNLGISIASVIQKEIDPIAETAEIVITTHPALESSVQQALKQLLGLPVVKEISNFIRIET